MWIPEEKVYIRIEDTVLLTDKGVENLTERAPHELDEVEALVGKGGIIQQFPPAAET
jgi:Xaa-Pro aminopeptidase